MRGKLRVVVAEDESLVYERIQSLLRDMGHTIVGRAKTGKQAVQLTKTLQPDVVFMDIDLPGMAGIEAIRQIYTHCPTPVVALTAYDSAELVHLASAAGVGSYLLKPPNMPELERAITITLARFRDMEDLRRLNDVLQSEIAERQRIEETLSREVDVNVAMAALSTALIQSSSPEEIASLVLEKAKQLGYRDFKIEIYEKEKGIKGADEVEKAIKEEQKNKTLETCKFMKNGKCKLERI